ncbi:transglycosylase SLT domain-containing protein [Gammaproteobacteria bacterium]|nr:transglycosylase SLT domain-containing protein [Gammaproteobacteria bacterium]
MARWLFIFILMTGCQSPEVKQFDNACDFLAKKSDWYRYVAESHSDWGVSSGLILAVIHQESSFKAEAGHKTKYLLGFIPWGRISSAYGFAQAKDAVWGEYMAERGGLLTERSRFKDAADFVGWYLNRLSKQLNIDKSDGYRLYLAYHDGPTGYRKKTYKAKDWLIKVAKKVSDQAKNYDSQISRCRFKLKIKSLSIF